MTVFDIATLLIAVGFITVGIKRGFVGYSLKLCALILSVLLSRLFGVAIGRALFSNLIISDRISADTLKNINLSVATILGTVLSFIIFRTVLGLLAKLVSRISVKSIKGKIADKLLGALLGVFFAAAAIYAIAFVVDIVAATVSLVFPNTDIYSMIERTVIFKYFFRT